MPENQWDNWTLIHSDVVYIQPMGKGRPRMNTRTGRAYTPKTTRAFEKKLSQLFRMGPSIRKPPIKLIDKKQPIGVKILAVFNRPQAMHAKRFGDGLLYKATKPDCDNVSKAAIDSLVKAGNIIHDDNQIVWHEIAKMYTERDGKPRIEVHIFAIPDQTK